MWTKGNSNSTPSLPRIDPQGQIRISADRTSWSAADLNATISEESIYNSSEGDWPKRSRPSRDASKQPGFDDKIFAWLRNDFSDLASQAGQLRGVVVNELRPSVSMLTGQYNSMEGRLAAIEMSVQALGTSFGHRVDGIEKRAKFTEDALRKNAGTLLPKQVQKQTSWKDDEHITQQIRELQKSLHEVRKELQVSHPKSNDDSCKHLSLAEQVAPGMKAAAEENVRQQIAQVENKLHTQNQSQKQTIESVQRLLAQEAREFRQDIERQYTRISAEQRQLSDDLRGSVRDMVDEQIAKAQSKLIASAIANAGAADASTAQQKLEVVPYSAGEVASVAQLDQLRDQEASARRALDVRIACLESELTWGGLQARVDAAIDVAKSMVTHDVRAEDRRILQRTEVLVEQAESRLRDSIFRLSSDMQTQLSGHDAQLLKSGSDIAALQNEADVGQRQRADQADAIQQVRSHCEEVEKSLMRHLAQQRYELQHALQTQIAEIDRQFKLLAKRVVQAEAVTEDCRGHCERRLRALSTVVGDNAASLKASVQVVRDQLRVAQEADASTRARLAEVEGHEARIPVLLLEELESGSKKLRRELQSHRQSFEDQLAGLHAAVAELAVAGSEAGESCRLAHASADQRWHDELVGRTSIMQRETEERVDKALDTANSLRLHLEAQQVEALQGRLTNFEALLMVRLRQKLATIEQEIVAAESRAEARLRETAGRAVAVSEATSLEMVRGLARWLKESLDVDVTWKWSEIKLSDDVRQADEAVSVALDSEVVLMDIPRGPAFAALQRQVAELPAQKEQQDEMRKLAAKAFVDAAKNGQLHVVLPPQKTKLRELAAKAFVDAAKNGQLQVILKLATSESAVSSLSMRHAVVAGLAADQHPETRDEDHKEV